MLTSRSLSERFGFRIAVVAFAFVCFAASTNSWAELIEKPSSLTANDWPSWRGPQHNGIAAADQQPPTKWSRTENVVWVAPVPGRGHGSPTVVGNHVYLASADEEQQTQSVYCFDREEGKLLWQREVHRGGLHKGHIKASQASSTIACDGERLFINFLNQGAIYTTALDRQGKPLWQTKVTDYEIHQGYGSSPIVAGSLVIVTGDNKGGGVVAALDRKTGAFVWKHERPKKPNYASPIILTAAGREQLILTGCDLVSSFDPQSGKKLWEIEGATTECVTSAVTNGELVYTSGGYPTNHISAVRADGSGKVEWSNNLRVYVPSMLVAEGYLYAVTDAGVAMCLEADTGATVWKARLGGTFSSSPVMVGNLIYATNEAGNTSIFRADPQGFKLIAENQLGTEVIATPTIVGSRIYHRVVQSQAGKRQELLYCLGE